MSPQFQMVKQAKAVPTASVLVLEHANNARRSLAQDDVGVGRRSRGRGVRTKAPVLCLLLPW